MPMSWQRPRPPTARGKPDLPCPAGCPAPPRWPGRFSCRHEVGLERLDRHLERRIGFLAPQFPAAKDHRVEPLRALARSDRRSIGKHVAPANGLDRAEL